MASGSRKYALAESTSAQIQFPLHGYVLSFIYRLGNDCLPVNHDVSDDEPDRLLWARKQPRAVQHRPGALCHNPPFALAYLEPI
jgi:hypothetical protein